MRGSRSQPNLASSIEEHVDDDVELVKGEFCLFVFRKLAGPLGTLSTRARAFSHLPRLQTSHEHHRSRSCLDTTLFASSLPSCHTSASPASKCIGAGSSCCSMIRLRLFLQNHAAWLSRLCLPFLHHPQITSFEVPDRLLLVQTARSTPSLRTRSAYRRLQMMRTAPPALPTLHFAHHLPITPFRPVLCLAKSLQTTKPYVQALGRSGLRPHRLSRRRKPRRSSRNTARHPVSVSPQAVA